MNRLWFWWTMSYWLTTTKTKMKTILSCRSSPRACISKISRQRPFRTFGTWTASGWNASGCGRAGWICQQTPYRISDSKTVSHLFNKNQIIQILNNKIDRLIYVGWTYRCVCGCDPEGATVSRRIYRNKGICSLDCECGRASRRPERTRRPCRNVGIVSPLYLFIQIRQLHFLP